mgnify:CR=1 FL=1
MLKILNLSDILDCYELNQRRQNEQKENYCAMPPSQQLQQQVVSKKQGGAPAIQMGLRQREPLREIDLSQILPNLNEDFYPCAREQDLSLLLNVLYFYMHVLNNELNYTQHK